MKHLRGVVKRIGVLIAVALLAAGTSGCGSHKKGGSFVAAPSSSGSAAGQASGSATPSASPSPSAVLIEFSVDGIGAYQLGASLDALKTTPGLNGITTGGPKCPDDTVAQGTGDLADVQLRFHKDGTLFLTINKSTSIPTPSGAWLGTPLAQLKTIYATVQGESLTRGTATAFLVTTQSGRAILFDLSGTQTVTDMVAGDGAYLRATYLSGAPDYC
jgi:hypothetical protein